MSKALPRANAGGPHRMEPWGFEPQIPPCHGGVIPFHYGPGIVSARKLTAGQERQKSIPGLASVNGALVLGYGLAFSFGESFASFFSSILMPLILTGCRGRSLAPVGAVAILSTVSIP